RDWSSDVCSSDLTSSNPERVVIARAFSSRDETAAGLVGAPETSVSKSLRRVERVAAGTDPNPVTAGDREVPCELVAVSVEVGLAAAVVGRPPDEVETSERRSGHRRVEDERDVEGL